MAFYQTSVRQNCDRTLINTHRSLFTHLDQSVACHQVSGQISPCVRKSEFE